MDKEELFEIPGKWEIPFHYSAGRTASRFFRELRDHKKLLATRCSDCGKVYMPPRSFCEACFEPIDDWVELPETGTLEAYTIVMEKFGGFPDPPYVLAFIKLDGADTSVAHFLQGLDLGDLETIKGQISTGMRVKVVFKDEREGRMTDFTFEPLQA